ncbi:MAG: flagellar biosynthesis protein FliQ [bacterium]|nr:flagellar biosynthesis protein FliQ [bacterium]
MDQGMAIAIFKDTLITTLVLSLPMLLAGLVIGVLISIFQAVTAIKEMTLSFVPKILAVGAVMYFTMPWMLTKLVEFTARMFAQMDHLIK